MAQGLGKLVWFENPEQGCTTAEFQSLPKQYRSVHPVQLGEALSLCTSKRSNIRIERKQGNYCMMYVHRDPDNRELFMDHVRTYANNRNYELRVREHIQNPSSLSQHILDEIDAFETKVQSLLATITGSKLTQNSINVIRTRCRGASVRKAGSVYFIPEKFSAELNNYIALIEKLGVVTFIVDAKRTATSIESLKTGTNQDLSARLFDMMESVCSTSSDRGYTSRMDELKELHDLAILYEGVLDVKMDEVKAMIQFTQNKVTQLIGELE